jgi:opacity protein-like surface antigen
LTSPVGVGLYFEPTFGHLKDAIETRLIVQSNFLDDRLQVVGNLVFEAEKLKFDTEPIEEIVLDFVGGMSYRFAPNWSMGIEYRYHNDYDGFSFSTQTQRAHF